MVTELTEMYLLKKGPIKISKFNNKYFILEFADIDYGVFHAMCKFYDRYENIIEDSVYKCVIKISTTNYSDTPDFEVISMEVK